MNMHTDIRPARTKPPRPSLWHIFAVPIVMGLLSTIGLIAALVGDDHWDWLSWATLGIPIAVIVWFWLRHRAAGAR